MTYLELKAACEQLGLGSRATLTEIKARYRELARKHHPDRNSASDPEQMHAVNEAYQLIRDYCSDYHFNFGEEEFYEQDPDARLRRQFASDPLWGGLKDEE